MTHAFSQDESRRKLYLKWSLINWYTYVFSLAPSIVVLLLKMKYYNDAITS